jgi:triosephosphate isomerase
MSALAARLAERTAGAGCRGLLYGGGVDLGYAAVRLALPSVDGLFVGRAAWSVEGLLGLVDVAAASSAASRS